MRSPRILTSLAYPALIALLSGCGYIHVGRLPPPPPATVVGDEKLMRENSDLRLEKKMLQQELALTRSQGDALRMAIENRAADGDTSKRLVERLNETSRELAALRSNYAKLQAERTPSAEVGTLQARLGATEEKLAASLRNFTELQEEITRLRSEVDRTRTENVALSEQVKSVTAKNEQAQAALAQLNTQLLAQKEARTRAEQDAETLRTQLKAATPNASLLAQQRTGAAAEAKSLAAEHAAEIAALKRELDTFRGKVESLESERAQLKQQLAASGAAAPQLADIEAKLSTALLSNAALRDENNQLKTTKVQLAATKTDLESQLARLKEGPAGAQVQTLRDQLREAQAHATALTEENTKLKTRLAMGRSGISEPLRIELASDPRNPDRARTGSAAGNEPVRPESAAPSNPPAPANPAPRNPGSGVNATLVATAPGSTPGAALRADPAGQPRLHVVAGGDTLSKISSLYYGTPTRWGEILAANRDILGENNNLVIGRTLRIP